MIDVGELISDPELGGGAPFTVLRPTTTLANEGEAEVTYTELAFTGIIQPARPSDINRLPEGVRISSTIHIWTAAEISHGGKNSLPDVIRWSGRSFKVVQTAAIQGSGYFSAWAEEFEP